MTRSTIHRYVSTLVALGYLEQGADRRYRLGLRVTDLGMSALEFDRAAGALALHISKICAGTAAVRSVWPCSTAPRYSTWIALAASVVASTRSI